ncbi:hydrolase [Nocardioides phosphati]|uniref:Hydrolase n=2 Tax=Nocardioides phosphati TaxID=1867775 RepID=A0ABQ2N536_9ACTN|nr:hydrolase [Nocardioides phosphati]
MIGMNDTPGQGDQDDPKNPFQGTPFEQLFGSMGAQGMPDLGALFSQVQAMMQPFDGPVNWQLATDLARKTVAASPDPSPDSAQTNAVADAVRLADLWLDEATDFSSGVTSTAAWSRAEWIESTREVWQRLVEPVAEHVVGAMGAALPGEAKAMAGPFLGMLTQMGGALFGSQIGTAIGGLASEVLTASDIGLPLGPTGRAALLPANIAAFAEGLDVPAEDVTLYLALREAAHQRLFAHVPWLREHLLTAVADYGRGISIDTAGIEEQLRSLDPSNMEEIQSALEGGLFAPTKSPAQEAALQRLETTLALVEGWVDEVVGQATANRMPSAARLHEAVRRRRAAGGPAEETFAALVGLELRPRRLRDASTLWGSLRARQGVEARDAVWLHPDLLPTADDLDDPLGFREGLDMPRGEMSAEEFDAALQQLLDGPDTGGSGEPDGSGEPGV